jgi:hypothetical protein
MYYGGYEEIIDWREKIKRETLKNRREEKLNQSTITRISMTGEISKSIH